MTGIGRTHQTQGIGRSECDFGEEGVLAEEIADEQILFAFVGKIVSCDLLLQVNRDDPREHWLSKGRGFVLAVDSASVDVICYICIDAGPVYYLSCLCLHFLHPLVGSLQVSNGAVEEFQGNADTASLEEEASLYRQHVPGAPEVSGDPQDLLSVIWPSP